MHKFKRFFSVLFTFFLASSNFAQDSNNVSYSLFIEKSVTFGTINTKIEEGSFKEGQSFTIPEAELKNDFSIYQNLYNVLVGGRFGIEYGALDNDIIMKIFIRNLNKDSGTYQNLGENSDTLFTYFEIRIWELPDSNFFPEDSSYYLNDGYHATFSLPKSQELLDYLDLVGITHSDSLAFAFFEDVNKESDDWNGYGINTYENADSIVFKSIHLSRIGGGRKTIAENIYVPNIVNDVKNQSSIPVNFKLEQNYPNPFNPSTKISYSIETPGHVKLKVYNILGRELFTLVDGYHQKGNFTVDFSTNNISYDIPSGIYIYTLNSNNSILTRKMILLK